MIELPGEIGVTTIIVVDLHILSSGTDRAMRVKGLHRAPPSPDPLSAT